MIKHAAQSFASLFTLLALASCASVSVEDGTEQVVANQKKPQVIYVLDFSTAEGTYEVDREGADLTNLKRDLQYLLQKTTATDLTSRLVFAEPGTKADWARHQNAWLIRGQFITVKQGSRALRGTIGLGAGGTKLETHVQVYDLSSSNPGAPFLTFSTSGGSNAEPGAAETFSTAPLTIALGGISGVSHGLEEDTKRTAREITAALSNYMYKRGWISKEDWIPPKRSHNTDIY